MRLYSRTQVALVAALSLGLGLAGAAGLAWLSYLRGAESAATVSVPAPVGDAPAGTRVEPLAAGGDPNGGASLVLADSLPGFSQDEQENIVVYERLNAGVVNITTEVVAIMFSHRLRCDNGTTLASEVVAEVNSSTLTACGSMTVSM